MPVSQDIQDFIVTMSGVVADLEAKLTAADADKAAAVQAVTDQFNQDHNDEVAALKAALATAQGSAPA